MFSLTESILKLYFRSAGLEQFWVKQSNYGTLSLKILVELDYIYLGLKYAFVVQLRTETLMSRWMGT